VAVRTEGAPDHGLERRALTRRVGVALRSAEPGDVPVPSVGLPRVRLGRDAELVCERLERADELIDGPGELLLLFPELVQLLPQLAQLDVPALRFRW